MRNKILFLIKPRSECHASRLEEIRHCSSPDHYHPYGEAWWWQHHAMGMFFSVRDWETS
jgi:hypothetical protein